MLNNKNTPFWQAHLWQTFMIAGTGITTRILAERYQAGDSIDDLVYDYEVDRLAIEEAIRCELPVAA